MILWTASAFVEEDASFRVKLSTRHSIDQLLAVDRPLVSGLRLTAETRSDRIMIRGRSSTSEIKLSVSLVHPSKAPKSAIRIAGAALLTTPGPALSDDVDEVVERLRRTGREIEWVLAEKSVQAEPVEDETPQYTNLAWLSVAGFSLLVAAFWHHRRRMRGDQP